MPTFTHEAQLSPTATSPPSTTFFDHTPRKSHERTSLSNTFIWRSDSNGENGHLEPSPDNFVNNYKGGSFQSLSTQIPNIPSNARERSHSRNGSGLSVTSAPRGRQKGELMTTTGTEEVLKNGVTASGGISLSDAPTDTLTNGVTSRPQSPSPRTVVNGDHTSSEDHPSDLTPATSTAPSTHMANATALLPVQQRSQPVSRHSSPAAPIHTDVERSASPSHPTSPRSPQRHTLQVPRFNSGRKNSRDLAIPNQTPSEDSLAGGDRYASPVSGLRRASLNLSRRATRSIHSDIPLDEYGQDEDAARWTEHIKQRRASKRRRKEEEDEERVIVGTRVDHTHVNWVTAYNMLTGIRFTVSRTNAKIDRELTPADFDARHKFSFDITGNELTPSAKYDFKFKDYAPWVFRHLRAKFKLDPADYLMSLTSKYILSELGSPGKSGSFFYFSRDYKYIIKTIHHAEHKLLRRILRDYYEHIQNNPNTLISQFYGLHRVKIPYGRKIHFVVMNNLFPPHRDIHQMFDLKGSTIGRDFREDDLAKNPRATLKDLNWLRRNRHLECGPLKKDVFMAQLKRDVSLLQRLNIMDYSLLIGIHDLDKGNEENLRDKTLQVFQPGGEGGEDQQPNLLMRTPSRLENARKAQQLREIIRKEKPVPMEQATAKMPDEILDERKNLVFYSDDGGFRATHEDGQYGNEIYYLGVIDCLTHYGMVKKAEHFWKGLSHNKTQISPIPPYQYGERFIDFVAGITMSREEAERKKQTQGRRQVSVDGIPTGPAPQRSSVERAMEKAEKQAVKSAKTLARDPEPSDRVLTTMRDSSVDLTGVAGSSTLPVVEEAGEASSTGGRSVGSSAGRRKEVSESEGDGPANGDVRYPDFRSAIGPSGPPPSRAPPPPPNASSQSRQIFGNPESKYCYPRSSQQNLPPIPNYPPPQPPPSSSLTSS